MSGASSEIDAAFSGFCRLPWQPICTGFFRCYNQEVPTDHPVTTVSFPAQTSVGGAGFALRLSFPRERIRPSTRIDSGHLLRISARQISFSK